MSSTAESDKVADAAPVVNEAEESTAIYDEKRRLYVGNVDYKTTPEEFSAFFEPLKAIETNLPLNPKTQRGFGFGFADFETTQGAEEALNDANGKKLHDRKVFVLVAKPPLSPEQKAVKKAERAARLKQRRKNKFVAGSNTKDGDKENDKGEGSSENRESSEEVDEEGRQSSKPLRKGPKPIPRKKGPPEGGVPSKNTVFVANLSFDTTNDQLRDYFSDFNPTWTSVVLRRLPPYIAKKLNARGERRLGRGFGFVRFEDENTQKKAVVEMDGKEIDGRKIVVKVAVDSVEEAAKQALKDILNEKVADAPEGAETSITETENTTTTA